MHSRPSIFFVTVAVLCLRNTDGLQAQKDVSMNKFTSTPEVFEVY
jgi:hypothetical protein